MEALGHNPACIIPPGASSSTNTSPRVGRPAASANRSGPAAAPSRSTSASATSRCSTSPSGGHSPGRCLVPTTSAPSTTRCWRRRRTHPYLAEEGASHENSQCRELHSSPDPFAGAFDPSPGSVRELAANSVCHGGGTDTSRFWREPGALVVEVADTGLIEQPLVGRVQPTPTQEGGCGLWMANQLCDLVRIRSGETGTAVRLHMSLN
jgi:Histidine kinase-like ATPase domain